MEQATKGKAKRRHLTGEECGVLGRSSEGPLTQPHTSCSRRGKHNSNRGLYPRTPTKKAKLGSPGDKQRGITDFFSVTGVVSSSPQKCSLPCSPGQAPYGELTPTRQPDMEKEEEEDDDDVSLLAAVVELEREQQEVDHLEGITADMFEDDDSGFQQFDRAAWPPAEVSAPTTKVELEEVDVEPLPDSHYGLLGSTRAQVEPQGCVDDLPEEVLRLVLSLVPAEDLYRSISLVCQRWRHMSMDPKFAPLKKRYYRLQMGEASAVQELKEILEENGILDSSCKQNGVLRLISVMACHKPSERIRPDHLLQCVKRHRLFPQADACISIRFPDLQKEDVKPYAAMAIILVLSERVADVQSLVSSVDGCMSQYCIVEYLNEMATLLLAMMRNKVNISNRIHYNIFYVLYLMQNAPSLVSSDPNGSPQVQVTHEQQQILSHDIQADHVVKIMAFAGTGKTTTLVQYAKQRLHLRFLYVAFNRSVATEARGLFPRNVDCKTIHSLAYADVGNKYQISKKLTFNLKPFSIAWVLPKGRGGYVNAKVVSTTLNAFMASDDDCINTSHVPPKIKNHKGLDDWLDSTRKEGYVRDAEAIWINMQNTDKREDGYKMTHDGYLKLWQLQNPKPRLSDKYDFIFIDEAQDCTPAIMDILLSQNCGKILVGDPHQQIYTFRGAVNALHMVPHTHIYYLTQSFRFGSEIAYVGATLLKVCKNVKKILVGGNKQGSVSSENTDTMDKVRSGTTPARGQTAILARCNVTVFSEAVRLTDVNPNCRIHFVGGVVGVGLSTVLDIWLLMQNNGSRRIQDPFIRSFLKSSRRGYADLKSYASQTEDKELEGKLAVVEKYGARVPQLVDRLKRSHENDLRGADFVLGTVHKAKGLEFDVVVVCDDFVRVPCAKHNLNRISGFSWDPSDVKVDEWNLLYVAVTRARASLVMTKNIGYILTMAGEYFLKTEPTSSLVTSCQPLSCSVRECHNAISPGSAFTMCKRPVQYMDGAELGGPLCAKCAWQRVGPVAFLMTDNILSMPETEERLELPINYQMLLFLF